MQESKITSPQVPTSAAATSAQKSGQSLATRALLAIALTIGFYTLALGMAAALLYSVYFEWEYIGAVPVQLALLCIVGAGIILWSVFPRPDNFASPGPRLTAKDQPELFEQIADIANKTGQKMPAEVYLIPSVNAWVAQRGGIMGIGSRRVMGIGLPLLSLLTASEFRAVLAHEFGHFYGGDTKLGPWIYRTRETVLRSLHRVARFSYWLHFPFLWYAKLFLRTTHSISRRQEFVADQLAARTVGSQATIRGLRAIQAGTVAFEAYWGINVMPVINSGNRPPLAEGFSHFIAAQPVIEALATKVQARTKATNPYDTHPSVSERVAALEKMPAGNTPDPDPFAISMLANVPDLEKRLLVILSTHKMIKNLKPITKLKPIAWKEVSVQTYFPLWEKQVRKEAAALAGVTPAMLPDLAANLTTVAQTLVEEGEGQASHRGASELQDFAIGILGAAFTVALHNEGWELSALPGDPICARRDQWEIMPFDVIKEMASGTQAADAWRELCADAGIANLDLGKV